jgi:hypothetical protein
LKTKYKRILKITLFAFISVGYVLGFAVIFNLKSVLGIGSYEGNKNFYYSTDGSTGGVNVDLYATHRSNLYHDFGYIISAYANGEMELVGLTYANYYVRTGGSLHEFMDVNFTSPRRIITFEDIASIRAGQNYTIKGYVDVIFTINNIDETHRIPIDIGIVIQLDGEQIQYNWMTISIWLDVFYLSFTVIPMLLLYRNIKAYRFEKWYNEELKEKDQKFLKILSKENENDE